MLYLSQRVGLEEVKGTGAPAMVVSDVIMNDDFDLDLHCVNVCDESSYIK